MGDRQLVRKAQQGNPEALDTLFRREWRPIYAQIYQAVQNRAEAEDLTQESFIRALRALDRYQDTGVPFRAFLATVARNLVRSHWRRARHSTLDIDRALDLASNDIGPESSAVAVDGRDRLDNVLRTLPADYETVIRLRIYEDRSTAEVAALMHRSPGAVRGAAAPSPCRTACSPLPEGSHRGMS